MILGYRDKYIFGFKGQGQKWPCFLIFSGCDHCYVSKILIVGSEPVISFFNKGKSFFGDLPFLQICKK